MNTREINELPIVAKWYARMPDALLIGIECKQLTLKDNPEDKVDMIRVYSKHWDGEKIVRKNGEWVADK